MTKAYMRAHPYCLENLAKQYYGETEEFGFAGYLLGDGTMLNFSYEGYQRDEDHRNIGQFFTTVQGWEAMVAFMKRGNIRVSCDPYGMRFEYIKDPTPEQMAELRRAERIAWHCGMEFMVDHADRNGRVTMCHSMTDELDVA